MIEFPLPSYRTLSPGGRGQGEGRKREKKMKQSDQYHKWVEWSEEDQTYIGKCPDLITGIHGDNPARLYSELCEVIEDVVSHFEADGRPLPTPRIRPMQEVEESPIFLQGQGGVLEGRNASGLGQPSS